MSSSKPTGVAYLCLASSLVAFCALYDFPSQAARGCTSLAACALATGVTVANRIALRPTTTFVLAAHSVLLNTIAFGSVLPFPLFVACSAIATAAQGFVSLPL